MKKKLNLFFCNSYNHTNMNSTNTTFIKHRYTKKEPWEWEVNIPLNKGLILQKDSTTLIYLPCNEVINKRWNDGGENYWGLCNKEGRDIKINFTD
jgi:hypothetical protein